MVGFRSHVTYIINHQCNHNSHNKRFKICIRSNNKFQSSSISIYLDNKILCNQLFPIHLGSSPDFANIKLQL